MNSKIVWKESDDTIKKQNELIELIKWLSEEDLNNLMSKLKNDFSLKVEENLTETREEKIKKILEKVKNKKVNFWLLKFLWEEDNAAKMDLHKTFKTLWVEENYQLSSDLEDLEPEKEHSHINYATNYKMWLWRKLFLTEKEIKEKSVNDIDSLCEPYLRHAIGHIEKIIWNFSNGAIDLLKSPYYKKIHNSDWKITVFSLLKFLDELKKSEINLKKEKEKSPRVNINYDKVLEWIKIWLFEIQRLLAITTLYIDREKNKNFQHTNEDTDFIFNKFKKLIKSNIIEQESLMLENPLYHMTNTKYYSWMKNDNGEYLLNQINEPNYSILDEKHIKLDWIEIEWRERYYKSEKKNIEVLHVWSRIWKWAFSAVDKFIRKWLSTFDEILDNKWFIFVVKNPEYIRKLVKVLENEFWTGETSWSEPPEYMSTWWNHNTNSSYNSLKGIIKVPYKGKIIKDFFEHLDKILKVNSKLNYVINDIKNQSNEWNYDFNKILEIVDPIIEKESFENNYLKSKYNEIKRRFWRREYYIEIEIQIFDFQNYMKAEIDEEHPAHHNHYKKKQIIDGLWVYFPWKAYWDRPLMSAISDVHK